MTEPREMTAEEQRAVNRVERAIRALPKSITLYFHGPDASVLDCNVEHRSSADPIQENNIGGIETPRCKAGDW
ncbi:MAG TPA: hypothetical protein VGV69_08395 [Solirubrobacterales bacterium]|nr:hypothetical protein [Solirubrobacterales bacterium]